MTATTVTWVKVGSVDDVDRRLSDVEQRVTRLERRVRLLSHGRDRIIVDGPITVHGETDEDVYLIGGGTR